MKKKTNVGMKWKEDPACNTWQEEQLERVLKKKQHPTPRGVERNKEADDEEEECLESDGLPNTGTIA